MFSDTVEDWKRDFEKLQEDRAAALNNLAAYTKQWHDREIWRKSYGKF